MFQHWSPPSDLSASSHVGHSVCCLTLTDILPGDSGPLQAIWDAWHHWSCHPCQRPRPVFQCNSYIIWSQCKTDDKKKEDFNTSVHPAAYNNTCLHPFRKFPDSFWHEKQTYTLPWIPKLSQKWLVLIRTILRKYRHSHFDQVDAMACQVELQIT